MTLTAKITKARAKVNGFTFGTQEWESAMQVVRALVAEQNAAAPKEEFCSIDSGEHRTRLLSGKII